jgi:hypothetical protein
MTRSVFLLITFVSTVRCGQVLNLKTHSEQVADKFLIQFKYPADLQFVNFDNETLGFGVKGHDSLIQQVWTILIEDSSNWNIELEKDIVKKNVSKNCRLQIDTLEVDGRLAWDSLIHVILTSDRLRDFNEFLTTIETRKL